MKSLRLLFLILTFGARLSARALIINVTYDASVTGLSGPVTNAAAVEAAFGAAVQMFENQYTNNATINITVYWGPAGPFSGGIDLGASQTQFVGPYTYADITNSLFAAGVSSADSNSVLSLPAIDPTGSGMWLSPKAEAKVLGLIPNDGTDDGDVGFANDVAYAFSPTNRAVPGKYDLIGVMEHELSETMGRVYSLGTVAGYYIPYDLFRFTAPGVRNFVQTDNTSPPVYFSVDNGVTSLKSFYTNFNMGDIQDWQSSTPPDSFDAFLSPGNQAVFSYADSVALDVLGYNSPPVTRPHLTASRLTNATLQITFTNGSNAFFSVYSSTNVALKATNWTLLGAPTQTTPGHYQFIDAHPTNKFRFYRVSSP